MGKAYDTRIPLFLHRQSEYMHMWKNNTDGQSLPRVGNAVKLSKILIAHASNSVCFFHPLSLLVNNKIKKLVK